MSVAFLNTNTSVITLGTSLSASMTVNAGGTNVVAFAVVAWDNLTGKAVTSITFDGAAMTSCGAAQVNTTGYEYSQVFYLVAPSTGSKTLAISCTSGTREIYANLVVFQGVDQTTPVRAGTYQGVNAKTITVTSNVNDLTLTGLSSNGSIVGTTQTSDGINNGGHNAASSDHATVAAASVVHIWTTAGTAWALVGFSIQAATAAEAVTMDKWFNQQPERAITRQEIVAY